MIQLFVLISVLLGCTAQIIEELSAGKTISSRVSSRLRLRRRMRRFFHPNLIRVDRNMKLACHPITPTRERQRKRKRWESVKQTLQAKAWNKEKHLCRSSSLHVGFLTRKSLLLSTSTVDLKSRRRSESLFSEAACNIRFHARDTFLICQGSQKRSNTRQFPLHSSH